MSRLPAPFPVFRPAVMSGFRAGGRDGCAIETGWRRARPWLPWPPSVGHPDANDANVGLARGGIMSPAGLIDRPVRLARADRVVDHRRAGTSSRFDSWSPSAGAKKKPARA